MDITYRVSWVTAAVNFVLADFPRQVTAVLFALSAALSAQSVPPAPTPGEIGQLAVKAIDERYLYGSSPAWRKARRAILVADLADRDSMYSFIASQLATLRDSELHLVSPSELAAIDHESKGTSIGTGLIDFGIDVVPATGEARIVTPLVGSPASASGLRPHDVIVFVDSQPTRTLNHEQVLDALRSGRATDLVIRRGARTFHTRLTPSDVQLHPVVAELKLTGAGKLGYIRIVQLTPDVPAAVRAAVERFEGENPLGYVLDLRNNPGGFLDAAASVAGLFVSGTLAAKVRRNGEVEQIIHDGAPLTQAPVVVLVNEGTASAAELVAAALQGRRAQLVGTSTYGRGQAQVYLPLSDGYGLIIPSALIRSGRGHLFKGTGIQPDTLVAMKPLFESELATVRDRQFQRAVTVLLRESRPR
jgi:carboxyl-terminal processing protease